MKNKNYYVLFSVDTFHFHFHYYNLLYYKILFSFYALQKKK